MYPQASVYTLNVYVCDGTVRQELDKYGFHCWVAKKKSLLFKKNMGTI